MPRPDGRAADELRPITFERDFTEMTAGSVLVTFGRTRVLCTASVDEDVPRWMRNTGKGWVTAEYSMLPGSSPERIDREAARGKQSGRTMEIQRLIGRSLRAVCDMRALGERQVARRLRRAAGRRRHPHRVDLRRLPGAARRADAASCSQAASRSSRSRRTAPPSASASSTASPVLDLPYVEDSTAEVDMNVVMTSEGRFVEVQGTAEGMAFSRERARRVARPRRGRAAGDLRAAGRVRRRSAAPPPVPGR